MRPGQTRRVVVLAGAVVLALLLQVTVLPPFGWQVGPLEVVPDLVLLVVVATALLTDARTAVLTGLGAGLLLDLAPPADHVAGRWALALLLVGYVVGRFAHDDASDLDRDGRRVALPLTVLAAGAGAFVGVSTFALSGLVLADTSASVPDLLTAVLLSVAQDVVAALLVVPALARVLAERDPRDRPRGPRRQRGPLGGAERSWARAG